MGDDKTDNTKAFSGCLKALVWVGAVEKFAVNGGASIQSRRIGSVPAEKSNCRITMNRYPTISGRSDVLKAAHEK